VGGDVVYAADVAGLEVEAMLVGILDEDVIVELAVLVPSAFSSRNIQNSLMVEFQKQYHG